MVDKIDCKGLLLSEIQSNIFTDSIDIGLDSKKFIDMFMKSSTAWHLDLPRHKASWCGKGYIFEEFLRENDVPEGKVWHRGLMCWIGYTYRFWHYITGQYSREIYNIAGSDVMMRLYPRLHYMSVNEAVRCIFRDRKIPLPAKLSPNA